ncbi:MAG TPA: hypothetical protein VH137_03185 [Gemmatimonadales bacterium]|nr:hypothetical protein [Gemmatimonadales bacterium]
MREPNGLFPLAARLAAVGLLAVVAASACGPSRYKVRIPDPPQLDLVPYGQIGLVEFTIEKAKGSLQEFATRRFAEEVLSAQHGIEVQELGPADSVLKRVGLSALGPAAAQALGGQRGTPVVFFGHLTVSNVKPRVSLLGLTLPSFQADVSAELVVELLSTKTGGTLWRSSATAQEQVGQLALLGGIPYFSAEKPNDAYGQLVNRLVGAVTRDLWPGYHYEWRTGSVDPASGPPRGQ